MLPPDSVATIRYIICYCRKLC